MRPQRPQQRCLVALAPPFPFLVPGGEKVLRAVVAAVGEHAAVELQEFVRPDLAESEIAFILVVGPVHLARRVILAGILADRQVEAILDELKQERNVGHYLRIGVEVENVTPLTRGERVDFRLGRARPDVFVGIFDENIFRAERCVAHQRNRHAGQVCLETINCAQRALSRLCPISHVQHPALAVQRQFSRLQRRRMAGRALGRFGLLGQKRLEGRHMIRAPVGRSVIAHHRWQVTARFARAVRSRQRLF